MNLIELKNDLLRDKYKVSLWETFKWLWVIYHRFELIERPHYKEMCEELQPLLIQIFNGERPAVKWFICNIPPRTGKTFFSSVVIPIWCWMHHPTKILYNSYSQNIALVASDKCKDTLNVDAFKEIFGEKVALKSGRNDKINYELINGGSRRNIGTNVGVTGTGYDIVIDDDPMDMNIAYSDKKRESAHTHVFAKEDSRFDAPTRKFRIVVMQPLHEDDTTAHLINLCEENDWKYKRFCLPAEYLKHAEIPKGDAKRMYTDNLLVPEHYPKWVLDDAHKTMGTLHYSNQFEMLSTPLAGNIFKTEWFNFISSDEFFGSYLKSIPHPTIDLYMDTATKDGAQNDYTGFVVAVVDNKAYVDSDGVKRVNKRMFVLEAGRRKLSADKLPNFIKSLHSHYKHIENTYIEDQSSGSTIILQLKQNAALGVKPYKYPKSKRVKFDGDKKSRAAGLAWYFQSGKVYFVGNRTDKDFHDELKAFPNAAHDDQVDAFVMASAHASLKSR